MTMGSQIPVIAEKPLTDCGSRKFQLDTMGDHLCTCTTHSGVKKDHNWVVEELFIIKSIKRDIDAKLMNESVLVYCLYVYYESIK